MPQVEKLKIFLASPGDVSTERRYVVEVVEEVNRLVAADKGIVFEVVRSEKNVFPGYGKDGQAILNDQIAKMQEYELFIGVMWNRIGTKTPRAKSGTVEEFGRAVGALRRKGKPQIWFYFRQSPAHLTTKEELKQREEVIEFKAKFQRGKGLFRNYKTPADFRNQFREQLILWLNQRKSVGSKPPTGDQKQDKKTSTVKAKSKSSVASNRTTTPMATAKTTTARKVSTTPRKTPVSGRSVTRSTGTVKSPGSWVMLNENFFQTESIAAQKDQSIVLILSPTNMEQIAELRSLHPGEFHNRKQIAYADQHDAGIMQVSSVLPESIAGKTRFNITLTPTQRSQNSGFVMEANHNNYSADEIAELRARLILLGQPLPKDLGRFFPNTQIVGSYNHIGTVEKEIFPELWVRLQTQPRLFLPKAWLTAVYCLKMNRIVEDVLELELGSIKNKVMPVRFRGRRRQAYANQEPSIIEVVGSCTLDA
jgi:hypothetical protein